MTCTAPLFSLADEIKADLYAPDIDHASLNEFKYESESLNLSAVVTDNVAVTKVILYYRAQGADSYRPLSMVQVVGTNLFTAHIPAESVRPPGVEYYLRAEDGAGNFKLKGYGFQPLFVGIRPIVERVETANERTLQQKKKNGSSWIWIALGSVAVAGLIAVVADSGNDNSGDKANDVNEDGSDSSSSASIHISAQIP
jgi:hypothetical protein